MNIRKKRYSIINDFVALLYPRLCLSCQNQLAHKKDLICLSCEQDLPLTEHHLLKDNEFTNIFYGRVPIQFGAARYYFSSSKKVKKLIHHLKYKSKTQIGIFIGKQYAAVLKDSPLFPQIDMIIPVPLHPIKLHQRGYNQSEAFGKGLSQVLQIPLKTQFLLRKEYTTSQTQKTRISRIENVKNAFEVQEAQVLKNQHILLIDDVLTTGATLEACANTLLEKEPSLKISMLTIAFAQ